MKSLLWVIFAVVFSAGWASADECRLCEAAEDGNLALMKAIEKRHTDVAELLLAGGAL